MTTLRDDAPRGIHDGTCDECGEDGRVQVYVETLYSTKTEGTFCSGACARAHQKARVGKLL